MPFTATPEILVFLFGIALLAGFVDSVAGGGGLISLPTLLAVGIPPHYAIATNKLQACFGSFSSTVKFTHAGLVKPHKLWMGIGAVAIGAILGSLFVQTISAKWLSNLIPIFLFIIFGFILFRKNLGHVDQHHKLPPYLFYPIFGLTLGFYDGFLGAGTGTFWVISLITILGLNFKTATANSRVMNFSSNFVAMLIFAISGKIIYTIGIVMAVGQIIGAFIGAHTLIKLNIQLIRIFFLIIVGITLVKITWSTYF